MSGNDLSPRLDPSELFRAHYPWLCTRLRRSLGQHHHYSVEDIAADAFVQLLENRAAGALREPRAWLTTIARRLVFEHWRRRDLERKHWDQWPADHTDCAPSPEEWLHLNRTLDGLDRRLDRLPGKVKATFLLSRIDGLTYPQIAAELGISQRSVSDYMTRSLALCARHSANQSFHPTPSTQRSA